MRNVYKTWLLSIVTLLAFPPLPSAAYRNPLCFFEGLDQGAQVSQRDASVFLRSESSDTAAGGRHRLMRDEMK